MEARSALRTKNVFLTLIIFLISLSGCHSVKVIATSELPVSRNCKYIIKAGRSKYLIKNPSFDERKISGNLTIFNSGSGEKIYLYPDQDSIQSFEENSFVTLDLDNLTMAESRKTKVVLTTVIVVAALIVFTPLKYLIIGGYDM
jgi:hypothetical protein